MHSKHVKMGKNPLSVNKNQLICHFPPVLSCPDERMTPAATDR